MVKIPDYLLENTTKSRTKTNQKQVNIPFTINNIEYNTKINSDRNTSFKAEGSKREQNTHLYVGLVLAGTVVFILFIFALIYKKSILNICKKRTTKPNQIQNQNLPVRVIHKSFSSYTFLNDEIEPKCTENNCHCEFDFSDINSVSKHMKGHFKFFNFLYQCRLCKFGCSSEEELKDHLLDSHTKLVEFIVESN